MPYITYITYEPLRPRRSNPASATTNHPPSHRTVHMHAHRDAPSNVPRARECTSHSSPSIHPSGPLRRRDIPLCPHSIAITAITAITAAAAAAMCPRPTRLHAPQHAPPAPPSDPPAAAIPCLGARGAVLTARGRAGCRWGGRAALVRPAPKSREGLPSSRGRQNVASPYSLSVPCRRRP